MHERDRRRTSTRPSNRPAVQRTPEPDFTEHKSYKLFVSKKLSVILGLVFLLTGIFGGVDYFGPKSTSREEILGFPAAANVFLIRTANSYFVIDLRLREHTPDLHHVPIDVDKSFLTKTPLSFSLPENSPGTKFYPMTTRYDYFWLFIVCAIAGLVLFFYPKYDFSRIYLIVFSVIIFFATVITPIALQAQINSIYEVKTIGW